MNREASIEESIDISNQTLSRLMNVYISEREEEFAESLVKHCYNLKDCSETYMRVRIIVTVTLVDIHC